ncbi:MAG: PAS domain S-box protein, partial [Dehalococcoidales bacterium]
MPDAYDKEDNDAENDDDDLPLKDIRRAARQMRRQRKKNSSGLSHNVFWGLMLILWAVIIILLQQHWITADNIWKYFLIGLGSIFIIQSVVRYFDPETRSSSLGRIVPGVILLFVGLGFLVNSSSLWPVALIAAGVAILFSSWFLQREIQRRKATQENLFESEVKYRHIIDNANSVIMEIDTIGNITFINNYGSDFFGFPEKELLGHNMAGTILPYFTSAGQVPDKLVESIAAEPAKYLHYEQENLKKNGDKVWITWTYKPIFDEANHLKEVLCIGID